MKTHALALGMAAAALLAARRVQQAGTATTRTAERADPEGAEGCRHQDHRRRSPAGSRFMAAAKAAGLDQTLGRPRARTRCSFRTMRRSTRRPPARSTPAREPRPADRHPHQSDPARHRAGRRHRQGDRQRQGQGDARDHGRRHADRDQGRRQDRAHRLPPGTRRRSPRATSSYTNGVVHESTPC